MEQLTNENSIISCWKEHALCEDCHREQIRPRLVESSYADGYAQRLNNGCPECREPMFDWFGITDETVDPVDEWYDCFKDKCPYRERVMKLIMKRFMIAQNQTPTQLSEWVLDYCSKMAGEMGVTDNCNHDLDWMNEEDLADLHSGSDVEQLERYLSWGGYSMPWEQECAIGYELAKHIFGLKWWIRNYFTETEVDEPLMGVVADKETALNIAASVDQDYDREIRTYNRSMIQQLFLIRPRVVTPTVITPVVTTGRRCGICRCVGHNRRTCPQR